MSEDSPALQLSAESLLSKWGFSDGDVLYDWWWELYGESPQFDTHDILHAVILEYLMPEVRKAGIDMELYRIHTNHNPVRASKMNGVDVDDISEDNRRIHPNITVSVRASQVQDLIDKLVIRI